MTAPHTVLPPDGDVAAAVRAAAAHGWHPVRGFVVPDAPWDLEAARVVAVGHVRSDQDAAAALLVAVRGGGLVVTVPPGAPFAAAFRADLARLAASAPGAAPDIGLDPEQCSIFDQLADGHSIAETARILFLSLRTTNRRIAQARALLSVSSTSEAVVAYVARRDAG